MRRPVLAISSVCFTIALLMLAPGHWTSAVELFKSVHWESGPLYRFHDCFAPMGFGSLAVTAIGLIVTWAGYIKGVRWTWFVMFVIVWVWAFPLYMLTFVRRWKDIGLLVPEFESAIRGDWVSRAFLEHLLAFLLMAVGLIIPLKAFFPGGKAAPGESEFTDSDVPSKSRSQDN